MFNGKYVKHLEAEIEYLRGALKDAEKQIMILSNKTGEYRSLVEKKEKQQVVGISDMIKRSQSVEAVTESEKKEKEEAPLHIMRLMGGVN